MVWLLSVTSICNFICIGNFLAVCPIEFICVSFPFIDLLARGFLNQFFLSLISTVILVHFVFLVIPQTYLHRPLFGFSSVGWTFLHTFDIIELSPAYKYTKLAKIIGISCPVSFLYAVLKRTYYRNDPSDQLFRNQNI